MAGRRAPTAADVLLVEDDRGDVMMISEAFRQSGTEVRVHVVGDGEQALRFLRRGAGYEQAPRPALILVDLDLPRRDGLEVLAALRADRTLAAAIPVVVLTISRAEQHIRRSYELGAAAYLVKPPDFTGFAAVIRQVTARFLGAGGGGAAAPTDQGGRSADLEAAW